MFSIILTVILVIFFIYVMVNTLWVINIPHGKETISRIFKPTNDVNNQIYRNKKNNR